MKNDNTFDNPSAGTVVDHTITRRFLFDFFLVAQNVRYGTVTPSHYVVIANEGNLSADILQRLSYKLTYQYFNWPGSIRVPAPCQVSSIIIYVIAFKTIFLFIIPFFSKLIFQYAHRLAFLVGQSIKQETSEALSDKLFYL